MRFYVASKFENREAVRAFLDALRAAGHEVTHDWTTEDDSGFSGRALHHYHRRCAQQDVDGVRLCDALVLLPHGTMRGAWIEVGCALALGKTVFVVGEEPEGNAETIFFRLPQVHYVADAADVVRWAALLEEPGRRWEGV